MLKITGEEVFSVPSNNFSISPSTSTYTFNYSVDGINFKPWPIPTTNDIVIVNHVPKNMAFKLAGNTQEVFINY